MGYVATERDRPFTITYIDDHITVNLSGLHSVQHARDGLAVALKVLEELLIAILSPVLIPLPLRLTDELLPDHLVFGATQTLKQVDGQVHRNDVPQCNAAVIIVDADANLFLPDRLLESIKLRRLVLNPPNFGTVLRDRRIRRITTHQANPRWSLAILNTPSLATCGNKQQRGK